jgi:hypothetical protein
MADAKGMINEDMVNASSSGSAEDQSNQVMALSWQ